MRSATTAIASAVACATLAFAAHSAQAQQRIPVVSLSPASARTTETFGLILGLRQVAGSNVLVDDAIRRQVKLFDSTLTNSTVVIDSTPGLSNSYGPRGVPLIPYLGDSSLFADIASQTLLVLDQRGQVARSMALPNGQDLFSFANASSGVDNKGRLIYKNSVMTMTRNSQLAPMPGAIAPPIQPPDSSGILRADLDTRRVDTIGRVSQPPPFGKMTLVPAADGKPMKMKRTINPLPVVDEWAVLSDGSIAFVRGHDYHIDWIRPDGTTSSTAKLPFDWKRLTDEDKQKLVDSARAALDSAAAKSAADAKSGANGVAAASEMAAMMAAKGGGPGGGGGGGGQQQVIMHVDGGGAGGGGGGSSVMAFGDGSGGKPVQIVPENDFIPLKEIADYYPAIRLGAAKADVDGNLWILPTTSAQSQNGELVYDVVNTKGELFERVRIPAGRSIAGFGKGGVVYLMSGDRTKGFYLERTRLIGGAKAMPQ